MYISENIIIFLHVEKHTKQNIFQSKNFTTW